MKQATEPVIIPPYMQENMERSKRRKEQLDEIIDHIKLMRLEFPALNEIVKELEEFKEEL